MKTTKGGIRDSDARWEKGFYACPGAWLGNRPDGARSGNIVVDADKILQAIPHLQKRFAIQGTSLSLHCGGTPGVNFVVEYKGKRVKE